MPFVLRPHSRLPVCCPMTYEVGHSKGKGTVWDISISGFRFSTDSLLQPGQVCSLTVELPNNETIRVAAAVVRWMLDDNFEYGAEVFVADKRAQRQVADYLKLQVAEKRVEKTIRKL